MGKILIGLLGYGTVGQGVAKIIQDKKNLLKEFTGYDFEIKKVLVNNLDKKREVKLPEQLFTTNADEILNDSDIDIVIEVISAIEPAKDMILKAMENGKSVVSANKAVISKYFEEFNEVAEKNNVHFLYEASVAGGIPVIKPLHDIVMQNEINRVRGILNGTCNYILSKMSENNQGYNEVLKEAQKLGYAEADPSSDVNGDDTLRKLRILSTIAFKQQVREENIILDGISNIKAEDIENLAKFNKTIKLIGDAWIENNEIMAVVQPVAIDKGTYFASVNDAYNSVTINGDIVGELKFYGSGAGMLPTGNAVMNDVIDIALDRQSQKVYGLGKQRNINSQNIQGDFYIRYNPNKLKTSNDKNSKEVNSKVMFLEDVKLTDLQNKLKDDKDAVIIRLEGADY